MKNLWSGIAGLLCIANFANAQSVNASNTPGQDMVVNVSGHTATSLNQVINLEQTEEDVPMRSKNFSKAFAADPTDKVLLSNQYGSIQVKTWNKKEIKVDIDIKAYSNNDTDAQKLLDDVSIDASKAGDQIIYRTRMNQRSRSWGSGSRNGKQWRREVRINYIVYMPESNALSMSQTYGNIFMGNFEGAIYAKVQYGNFSAANLNNTNNNISVQYGKTNIQQLNKAVINQQYGSGLIIGSVGTLDLDAQYTSVNINTVRGNAIIKQQYGSGLIIGSVVNLDLNVQYANVNINSIKGHAKIDQQYNALVIATAGKLDLDAQYTNATIGLLKGDGNFNMQYNKLNINEITNDCKVLYIDGDYLGIFVNFNDSFNANFDVLTSYASFKYGNNVTSSQVAEKSGSNKSYFGKIGNGGAALVKIKADYGAVTFK